MREILLVPCLLVCAPLLKAEHLTVVYGDYPPFSMGVTPDGVKQVKEGMLIDFLKEFSRHYPEYTFNNICLPRKRMDAMMLSGQVQVFALNNPMFVREGREEFLWTIPIWHTMDTVVTVKGKEFKFEKPEDLFGKTIGKIFGNGYGEYDAFFEKGKIKTADAKTMGALAKMALTNRIDAFFGNIHATPYNMKKAGLSPSRFTFFSKPILEFDLMMQINKNYPDFRNKMNTFILKSKQNGLLKGIENKYLK